MLDFVCIDFRTVKRPRCPFTENNAHPWTNQNRVFSQAIV
uniref:Uncharacterized protein n=1 Tax=Anguilla anguilla TaxID=7936 RepID=A0A0E9XV20_ANGAN